MTHVLDFLAIWIVSLLALTLAIYLAQAAWAAYINHLALKQYQIWQRETERQRAEWMRSA